MNVECSGMLDRFNLNVREKAPRFFEFKRHLTRRLPVSLWAEFQLGVGQPQGRFQVRSGRTFHRKVRTLYVFFFQCCEQLRLMTDTLESHLTAITFVLRTCRISAHPNHSGDCAVKWTQLRSLHPVLNMGHFTVYNSQRFLHSPSPSTL